MNFRSFLFSLVPMCLLLASCGTMTRLKDKTSAGLTKVSQFSVTDILPSKVKVAEVREQDLKLVTMGRDRALAYDSDRQASRRGGFFGFFRGPVDFKEPMLPGNSGAMDGSLLPPLAN